MKNVLFTKLFKINKLDIPVRFLLLQVLVLMAAIFLIAL